LGCRNFGNFFRWHFDFFHHHNTRNLQQTVRHHSTPAIMGFTDLLTDAGLAGMHILSSLVANFC
jgi:hypothetical protein